MKVRNYILIILFILIASVFYIHLINLKKINNKTEIITTLKPDIYKIQDILQEKSPTIFKDVLYEWEPFVNIFDKSMIYINNQVKNNKIFRSDLIDCMNNYSMFLSFGWEYYITEKQVSDIDDHFTYEEQHRHLICQITGTQRYYLASPNQTKHIEPAKTTNNINYTNSELKNDPEIKTKLEKLNRKKQTLSKVNFWNENETNVPPFSNLEYIEIILREGNVLYIPYGWWYLAQTEEDGLVCECFNLSAVSLFV